LSEAENVSSLLACLRRFGAPAAGIEVSDLMNPDLVYQIGVEPVRVDILNSIPPLDFGEAWLRRSEAKFDDVVAPVVSLDDLIRAKQTAGRGKDRLQARQLERAKRIQPRRRS
jgi:hypothetical protein